MPRGGQLIRPGLELFEQGGGRGQMPALDGGLGEVDHTGQPDLVQGEIEVCGCELLQQATGVIGAVSFHM